MKTATAADMPAHLAHGLHVMAKPIGPICNLDCEYCYYLHKEELYGHGERWRMTEETLREFIRQYVAAQPPHAEEVTFAWQGGEPTLLGVEFFERAIALQRELTPPGRKIVNTLQTNGVLLDDRWCEFFRTHNFLVGLSIDGPAELHDRYRYDKQGRGTFAAVLRALKLLQRHRVEFNALVVVNSHNGDHGRRVYTYLRDNGVQFLQFIPVVERHGVGVHAEVEVTPAAESAGRSGNPWRDRVSSRSVAPEQFGDFLIAVFDEWVRRDVGRVFVQIFDQALAAWTGHEPSLCVFRRTCGGALALEHNGDLFSCDHFVEPQHRLGNIGELPLLDLATLPQQTAFGQAKETTLPDYCRRCEVRFVCNGECPKNRFIETPDGAAGLNYLCAGYRKFFNHIAPAMRIMAEELRHGRPAANIRQRLKPPTAPNAANAVGRNDPCPCGSGRKFKKCCRMG